MPPTPPRLIFLDWIRIFAFGLLVIFHTGMYYVTWGWHVKSPHSGRWLEPWMDLSAPWRMTLLFIVSGAATAIMFGRRGANGAMLRQRAGRLLWPLLFGVLVIVPPQSYFEVVQRFGYGGRFIDFLRLYFIANGGFCDARGCLILPTWNHLWFLPYLFTYTALLWCWLRLHPRGLDALAHRLPVALAGVGLILWPLLFFAATGFVLWPLFPPTHALVGDWFLHSQYLAAFVLGAVLARSGAIWPRFEAQRWIALVLAVSAWAWLVSTAAIPGSSSPWRALARGTQQWCAIVAALGFAHRHLNRDSKWRRYLTEAVFPIYILHQTLIVMLAVALVPVAMSPVIEGPLIVIGTFAFSLLGFEIVRRVNRLRSAFGLSTISV